MHRLVLTLALTVGLVFRSPVRAADQVVYPFPDDLSRFSQYVESLRAQAGVPGLAGAIIGSDRLLWEHAFGQQDLERLIAANPSTPFHFNGLTQLFTASMVLRSTTGSADSGLRVRTPTPRSVRC
jgi:CubicO group peptidase (beta-lactamase class C family)